MNKKKIDNVTDYERNNFLRNLAIGITLLIVFLSLPGFCLSDCAGDCGHDNHMHHHEDDHIHHDHEHVEEPPSFKWSRAANQDFDSGEHASEEHHHHHHSHDDVGHEHHHGLHGLHDHHHEHPPHTGHHHQEGKKKVVQEPFDLWLHALGSTLLISAAPYFILYFINLDNTDAMKPRLKVLLAFASGGLLGDAFLHLIPHAIAPHSHHGEEGHHHHHHHHEHKEEAGHDHHHDMSIGLWVLSGIMTFLVVEKGVRLLRGGHGHSHGPTPQNDTKKNGESKEKTATDKKTGTAAAGDKKKSKPAEKQNSHEEITVSGYLNLAADFTHNFTDGLAIGASYLAGNSIGIVTTITILLHEVPHEIGDFAILIKSGCSKRKAMALQLVTAVGAITGTVISLLGSSGEAAPWVLPFTAGGFIYIATVSVLPELLEESTKLGQSIKEISAMLAGVGLMVLISALE